MSDPGETGVNAQEGGDFSGEDMEFNGQEVEDSLRSSDFGSYSADNENDGVNEDAFGNAREYLRKANITLPSAKSVMILLDTLAPDDKLTQQSAVELTEKVNSEANERYLRRQSAQFDDDDFSSSTFTENGDQWMDSIESEVLADVESQDDYDASNHEPDESLSDELDVFSQHIVRQSGGRGSRKREPSVRIQTLLSAANDAFLASDNERAMTMALAAIRLDSQCSNAYWTLALVMESQAQYQQAYHVGLLSGMLETQRVGQLLSFMRRSVRTLTQRELEDLAAVRGRWEHLLGLAEHLESVKDKANCLWQISQLTPRSPETSPDPREEALETAVRFMFDNGIHERAMTRVRRLALEAVAYDPPHAIELCFKGLDMYSTLDRRLATVRHGSTFVQFLLPLYAALVGRDQPPGKNSEFIWGSVRRFVSENPDSAAGMLADFWRLVETVLVLSRDGYAFMHGLQMLDDCDFLDSELPLSTLIEACVCALGAASLPDVSEERPDTISRVQGRALGYSRAVQAQLATDASLLHNAELIIESCRKLVVHGGHSLAAMLMTRLQALLTDLYTRGVDAALALDAANLIPDTFTDEYVRTLLFRCSLLCGLATSTAWRVMGTEAASRVPLPMTQPEAQQPAAVLRAAMQRTTVVSPELDQLRRTAMTQLALAHCLSRQIWGVDLSDLALCRMTMAELALVAGNAQACLDLLTCSPDDPPGLDAGLDRLGLPLVLRVLANIQLGRVSTAAELGYASLMKLLRWTRPGESEIDDDSDQSSGYEIESSSTGPESQQVEDMTSAFQLLPAYLAMGATGITDLVEALARCLCCLAVETGSEMTRQRQIYLSAASDLCIAALSSAFVRVDMVRQKEDAASPALDFVTSSVRRQRREGVAQQLRVYRELPFSLTGHSYLVATALQCIPRFDPSLDQLVDVSLHPNLQEYSQVASAFTHAWESRLPIRPPFSSRSAAQRVSRLRGLCLSFSLKARRSDNAYECLRTIASLPVVTNSMPFWRLFMHISGLSHSGAGAGRKFVHRFCLKNPQSLPLVLCSASFSFQSSSSRAALADLTVARALRPDDPAIELMTALCLLKCSYSKDRFSTGYHIQAAFAHLWEYCRIRGYYNPEAAYNMARACQEVRLNSAALALYRSIVDSTDPSLTTAPIPTVLQPVRAAAAPGGFSSPISLHHSSLYSDVPVFLLKRQGKTLSAKFDVQPVTAESQEAPLQELIDVTGRSFCPRDPLSERERSRGYDLRREAAHNLAFMYL